MDQLWIFPQSLPFAYTKNWMVLFKRNPYTLTHASVWISVWMSMFCRECLVTLGAQTTSFLNGPLGDRGNTSQASFLQLSWKTGWILQTCWVTSQIRRSMMLFFPPPKNACEDGRGTLVWRMGLARRNTSLFHLDKGSHKWLITFRHVQLLQGAARLQLLHQPQRVCSGIFK